MGLFGKLLLFVNLLAAGGFAYLALQEYKGRQTIAAAGLRHQLIIDGLPFSQKGGPDVLPPRVAASADGYDDFTTEEIPFEIAGPGNVMTKTVSPELLYVYFTAAGDGAGNPIAGSTPVASQMAEVKRVWGIIKGLLDKADGPAAKSPIAAQYLIFQAETIEERTEYLEWMAKGNGNELMHALDLRFHRVSPKLVEGGPLNPDLWGSLDKRIKDLETERDAAKKAAEDAEAAGNATEGAKKKDETETLTRKIQRNRLDPPKDDADRHNRLAHLLVHLDQAAVWQKRVAMVLGLKAYVKAVDAQAGRFKIMADRVDVATVDDQERFIGEYAQLRTLAIQRTQLVIERAELKAQLTAQAQKDQDLVNQRMGQLTDLNAERTKLKAEVDQLLAKQTLVEKKLFEVEREIGLTLEDVYKLEVELKSRERLRYEQKQDR